MSYTFATLEVSKQTFDEIASLLRGVEGYGRCFIPQSEGDEIIDMHGIGLRATKPREDVER
jgi:hypothetical protein